MEVGTFFEAYEVNNEKLKIGKAKEINLHDGEIIIEGFIATSKALGLIIK